jgi:hypothetical protein
VPVRKAVAITSQVAGQADAAMVGTIAGIAVVYVAAAGAIRLVMNRRRMAVECRLAGYGADMEPSELVTPIPVAPTPLAPAAAAACGETTIGGVDRLAPRSGRPASR